MSRRVVDYLFRVGSDEVSPRFKELGREEEKLKRQAGRGWEGYERQGKQALSSIGAHARGEFGQIEQMAAGLGRKLVGAFSIGAAGLFMKDAVKDFASFQDQMSGIALKTDQTLESMGGLKKEIEEFSQKKGVKDSMVELAEAMNELTGAGFKQADAWMITKSSAIAANGALTKTPIVVGGLISILQGFHRPVSDVNRTLSQMAFLANEGRIELKDLSQVMNELTEPAQRIHASFEQVGAAIEALSINGVSNPNEAATAVGRLMETIAHPDFQKKATALGIQIFDKNRNLKSFDEILNAVSISMKRFKNDQDQAKFLQKLGVEEIRTARALIPLFNNLDSFNTMLARTLGVTRAYLENIEVEVNKRASASIDQMTNQVGAWKKAVGEEMIPLLEKLKTSWDNVVNVSGTPAAQMHAKADRMRNEPWYMWLLEGPSPWRQLFNSFQRMPDEISSRFNRQEELGGGGAMPTLPYGTPNPAAPIIVRPNIYQTITIDPESKKVRTETSLTNPTKTERRVPLGP